MAKLYVYDSSSTLDRKQAAGRFSGDSGITTLGVGSVQELHLGLARLVANGVTFNRVLFQTHGNSGMIFFNDRTITASDFSTTFASGAYYRLFPQRTKVYFDGCNVAAGDQGWGFLSAAGKALLRNAGGITMGYTSLGTGFPGWLPFKGGHTVHFAGGLRFIEFRPGPVWASQFDANDASIPEQLAAFKKLDAF